MNSIQNELVQIGLEFSDKSYEMLERCQFNINDLPVIKWNRKESPVIIYQMGKVGSKTVQSSLMGKIPNPIYHSHLLSNQGLNAQIEKAVDNNKEIVDNRIRWGIQLRRMLHELKKENKKVKIISLVREAIGIEISALFQNLDRLNPQFIQEDGKLKTIEIFDFLHKKFSKKRALANSHFNNWFDIELNQLLDIDIYAYPYDIKKGYQILKFDNADVLLMKMEDLNTYFTTAIKDLLGVPDIPIVKSNTKDDKSYKNDYNYVISNLKIPREVCEHIYSSKCFNHFYSQEEKSKLIDRWGK